MSAQNFDQAKNDNHKHQEAHFEGNSQPHAACVPPELRAKILEQTEINLNKLRKEGKIKDHNGTLKNMGSLQWPLRAADHYDECGYYSVFQYFDHDLNFGSVKDWNCGTITYDVPGYNHRGTDIGITPFPWNMMNDDNVEVIAAAPGLIIQKQDGFYDKECNASSLDWNYILVRHADGSFAMYGHMKSGSVTSLNVGDQINAGDYVGIVGSSGASTGPHLHFEILDQSLASIDPYGGPCNSNGMTSMWADQHDYYDKGINRVMTHSAPPNNNTCPSLETTNEQILFDPGSSIYLGSYVRHAHPQDTFTITLLRPDGTNYWTKNHVPTQFYASYLFYYSMYIPPFEQSGVWTFSLETTFGDSCSTLFGIGVDEIGEIVNENACEEDAVLSGLILPESDPMKVEVANSINSTAVISANADMTYDAGNYVQLNNGFEVVPGAVFEAYIDGCDGN